MISSVFLVLIAPATEMNFVLNHQLRNRALALAAWIFAWALARAGAGAQNNGQLLHPVAAPMTASLKWEMIDGGRRARLDVPRAGRTGFVQMEPGQTGIRFTNTLEDRRIMENNNFMEGAGVA